MWYVWVVSVFFVCGCVFVSRVFVCVCVFLCVCELVTRDP